MPIFFSESIDRFLRYTAAKRDVCLAEIQTGKSDNLTVFGHNSRPPKMYLRQATHKHIIRKEAAVSFISKRRFPISGIEV